MEPIKAPPAVETFVLKEGDIRKPFEEIHSATKQQNSQGAATGYKVSLFLDGRINLQSVLQVDFDERWNGTYKITSINHKMDYEGNDWLTELNVQREEQKDAT